jgi:hypothetical protein
MKALRIPIIGALFMQLAFAGESSLTITYLRRCLPEKLLKTPVTLKCNDADREWMSKIVTDFNAHDRAKVFWEAD